MDIVHLVLNKATKENDLELHIASRYSLCHLVFAYELCQICPSVSNDNAKSGQFSQRKLLTFMDWVVGYKACLPLPFA